MEIKHSNYVKRLEDEILLEKLQDLKAGLINYAYAIYGADVSDERRKNEPHIRNYDADYDIKEKSQPVLPSNDSIVHGAVKYHLRLQDHKSDMENNNYFVRIAQFVPNSKDWNIRGALQAMQNPSLVHPKSTGTCARSVRSFIEAGGLSTAGRPVSACRYTEFLPKIGFRHIATLKGKDSQNGFMPQPGDISVMNHGVHGHICMWSGYQWVSDFPQRNMWPYAGEGICNIFRYSKV